MKDPALLLYTNDLLTEMADLDWVERGKYVCLICLQHQKGHLSAKTICLQLGLSSVSEMPDLMAKFSLDENGLYFAEWVDAAKDKRAQYAESRRVNGKKGGRPKKENLPEMPQEKPYANHMQNHMESKNKALNNLPENENVNEIIIDNETKKTKPAAPKPAAKPKPERVVAVLFRESNVFDFTVFESKFKGTQYEQCNLHYYHEAALVWSDNNNKKIDWIATVKGFMLRDIKAGTAAMKSTNLLSIQHGNNPRRNNTSGSARNSPTSPENLQTLNDSIDKEFGNG